MHSTRFTHEININFYLFFPEKLTFASLASSYDIEKVSSNGMIQSDEHFINLTHFLQCFWNFNTVKG